MWICSDCSEEVEDQFETCWRCAGKTDVDPERAEATESPVEQKAVRRDCPDCREALVPIQLIDHGGRGGDGGLHYGTEHAQRSFLGQIPRSGLIRGWICPDCGRIVLFGEPHR